MQRSLVCGRLRRGCRFFSSSCTSAVKTPSVSASLLEMNNAGNTAFQCGDYSAAIKAWRKIIDVSEVSNVSGTPGFSMLRCLDNLASAHRSIGDVKGELETLTYLKCVILKHHSEHHPQYTQLLCSLATAQEQLGDVGEMVTLLTAALNLLESKSHSSKQQEKIARVLMLLSRAYGRQQKTNDQLAAAEKSFSILRKRYSADSVHTGDALLVLARAKGAAGDVDEQLRVAQNVYEVQTSQFGKVNGRLTHVALELAAAFHACQRYEDEKNILDEAMDIQSSALQPMQATLLVDILLLLGGTQRHLGRLSLMETYNGKAVQTCRKHLHASSVHLGYALVKSAHGLCALDKAESARKLLIEAREVLGKSGAVTHHPVYLEMSELASIMDV